MSDVIEIRNLKKYYGDVRAVDDVSFTVERGTLFAFLGKNGAGKSTTINVLSTLLKKDEGTVIVDGVNLDDDASGVRKNIGIVFQNSVLDNKLTVKENLTVRASFYGLRGAEWSKRLAELTEMLAFDDILNRPFGKLSGGQKRKIDIARGLINCPELLFLDEPTTGLDPNTRRTIWDIINVLRERRNMTVFLTTHYMEEAEKANRIVIIDSGKIIADGTPNELKNRYSGDYVKLYAEKCDDINLMLENGHYDYKYDNKAYVVRVNDSKEAFAFLTSNAKIVGDFEVVKGDMDDVFLNATGKKLEA